MTVIDLRCGPWQRMLAGVATVDALISDPPYGERTHAGTPALCTTGLAYSSWGSSQVVEFVGHWAPRTRGWFCVFCSHDLVECYESSLREAGRYVFAPVACVQSGSNVRLAGDGPSSWTTWLVVARPKSLRGWGTLPGAYVGTPGARTARLVPGQKPLWLMRSIVRDYTRAGDLVCDPCAGGATTLIAARIEGRRAIGAELNPITHAMAERRITSGELTARQPSQCDLPL